MIKNKLIYIAQMLILLIASISEMMHNSQLEAEKELRESAS